MVSSSSDLTLSHTLIQALRVVNHLAVIHDTALILRLDLVHLKLCPPPPLYRGTASGLIGRLRPSPIVPELVLSGVILFQGALMPAGLPWTHPLDLGDQYLMILGRQEIRVPRPDCLFQLRVTELRVTVQVETPDDGKQLCFQGLVTHLLEKDAQAALSQVA